MIRTLIAALAMIACAAPVSNAQSIVVGRIAGAKMIGTLQDLAAPQPGAIWHGEVYELDVITLKVLSGDDPGESVKVKVAAHAQDFEGMMVTLVIDPSLKLAVPGQSWWTATDFREPVCVPKELVAGSAYRQFAAKSFDQNGGKCVRL